jgi:hypothetical protein
MTKRADKIRYAGQQKHVRKAKRQRVRSNEFGTNTLSFALTAIYYVMALAQVYGWGNESQKRINW